MKIQISEEGKRKFYLSLPTCLGLNYVSATFAPLFINKSYKDSGFKVTVPMCWKFVHAFYKCRKHFGKGWNLVEVETTDGNRVKITV